MAKRNHLTIVSLNYFPEDTAIGLYTTQLAEYLAEKDYSVTVLAGFPYYPQWKIYEPYQNQKSGFQEMIRKVYVVRTRQYMPRKASFLGRLFLSFSYGLGVFINSFRIEKPDVVLCIVPSTTSIFTGVFFKFFRRAKLWTHIQDFEIDAALGTSIIKKSNSLFSALFQKVLYTLEKVLLNRADIVTTISDSMVRKLGEKTMTKHALLPNWIDSPLLLENDQPHQYFTPGKFTLLYSGAIAQKQDWEFFLLFAERIGKSSDCEILIVGDGAMREWLHNSVRDLPCVRILAPVRYAELPSLLRTASLHFLFQRQGVCDSVMPSKLLGMMASGRPSIVTAESDTEIANAVKQSGGGICLKPGNVDACVEATISLKRNEEIANAMGASAKNYVGCRFSKDGVLSKVPELIDSL